MIRMERESQEKLIFLLYIFWRNQFRMILFRKKLIYLFLKLFLFLCLVMMYNNVTCGNTPEGSVAFKVMSKFMIFNHICLHQVCEVLSFLNSLEIQINNSKIRFLISNLNFGIFCTKSLEYQFQKFRKMTFLDLTKISS